MCAFFKSHFWSENNNIKILQIKLRSFVRSSVCPSARPFFRSFLCLFTGTIICSFVRHTTGGVRQYHNVIRIFESQSLVFVLRFPSFWLVPESIHVKIAMTSKFRIYSNHCLDVIFSVLRHICKYSLLCDTEPSD